MYFAVPVLIVSIVVLVFEVLSYGIVSGG